MRPFTIIMCLFDNFLDMNKFIICVLWLTISSFCHAQEVLDTVAYRFVYDVQLKTMESSKYLDSDEHWLDIGKNGITSYFSAWKSQRATLLDSLYRVGGDQFDMQRTLQDRGIETSYFDYYVYKNVPATGKQTVILTSADYFQYEEEMGQVWNLEDGDSLILNHPCSKATTNYHGRIWNVWFAQDIPIADGPWKLCGLPGLILAAKDSKAEFVFRCIGILDNPNDLIKKRKDRLITTTPFRVHRSYEFCITDFDSYMNAKHGVGTGRSVLLDRNGKMIPKSKTKRVFIETYKH